MHALRVNDIMSSPVWSVRETTSLKELSRVLAAHGVSGVPVVDGADRVVGVVSEADLLRRQLATLPRRWKARLLSKLFGNGAKRTVGQTMTAPPAVVRPQTTVHEAARQMSRYAVKRLPVLGPDDRLVGIITRADLVRAFARTDDELYTDIVHQVLQQDLCIPVGQGGVSVSVTDGVVTLTGTVEQRSLKAIATAVIGRVPGVIEVRDELEYTLDDARLPAPEPSNVGIVHRHRRS